MQSERRLVGDANARRADAVDGRPPEWRRRRSSCGSSTRTSAPPSEMSAVRPRTARRIDPQFDADFAGQPVVPPAIAGLALAQEYRHPHLELFGKRDDVLAVLLDGFPVARLRRPRHRGFRTRLRIRRRQIASVSWRCARPPSSRCSAAAPRTPRSPNSGRRTLITSVMLLHRLEAVGGVALQRIDFLRDFFGRLLRLLRELLDFGGDDRKAAAGFAGAGSFDGGVERQQIGLPRHRGDQVQDMTDFGRRILQPLDAARRRASADSFASPVRSSALRT